MRIIASIGYFFDVQLEGSDRRGKPLIQRPAVERAMYRVLAT